MDKVEQYKNELNTSEERLAMELAHKKEITAFL